MWFIVGGISFGYQKIDPPYGFVEKISNGFGEVNGPPSPYLKLDWSFWQCRTPK